tara:strand:- start:285 stop:647 length:363 start_codon:yes stop_codon:yes gene_type:complete
VLPGSSFGEKRRKRVVILVLTVLVFRHLPIRTYAVFCLFASREKEGEIFKIQYIKFKTNGHKFPLKLEERETKIFKKKKKFHNAPKQNSSQHEFPVWIPAWPMCNEITSLIIVYYYLRCF